MHKMRKSCIRSRVGKQYQDVKLEKRINFNGCVCVCAGTWGWKQVSQALFEVHRMRQVVEFDQYGGQGF